MNTENTKIKSHRILLTGAGGFLGKCIRGAVESDRECEGLFLSSQSSPSFNIETLAKGEGWEDLEKLVVSFRPTALIHLAWAKVRRNERMDPFHIHENVDVSKRLAQIIVKHFPDCRLIGIGSQAELGVQTKAHSPQSEGSPTSLYGEGKALLRNEFLHKYPQNAAWIRILTLYGSGDHGEKFVPYLLECLKQGRDAETSPGGQVWDFLHVSDAALALLSAAKTKDFRGLYVLSSGQAWALKDVASFLFQEAQKYIKVPQLKLGARSYGAQELMCLEGDSSALQKASGWRPRVKLEEALAQLVRETLGPST